MNRSEQTKTILGFIKGERLCVLATNSKENKPEAAVLAYAETEDMKLVVATSNTTRKYSNLMDNPQIALVIGWDLDKFITVQYEGIAHEATKEEIVWAKSILTAKNEESKKYANDPNNRYFIISPTWVRYWAVKANQKFELTF